MCSSIRCIRCSLTIRNSVRISHGESPTIVGLFNMNTLRNLYSICTCVWSGVEVNRIEGKENLYVTVKVG